MVKQHTCKGDDTDPTHRCQCNLGTDHSADLHRWEIAGRPIPFNASRESDHNSVT